ncbi:hypothetical protein ABW19_dt0206767 [Dactylella cylindrospora]|nr:hypothetical protein ABW19_dt0206767 [Dactylella cylindrospora]
MPTKKRTAASSSSRSSRRNANASEPEQINNLQNATNPDAELQPGESISPRKKAKTGAKLNTTEEGYSHDVPMKDADSPVQVVIETANNSESNGVSEVILVDTGKPQPPKLDISTQDPALTTGTPPDTIMHSDSPTAEVSQQLEGMIFNEDMWSLFTEDEKNELVSLLHPIDSEITDPNADPANPPPRIPTPILFQNLNNDAFRSAFAELQDDLATGSYEPGYVKKAHEALEQRLGPMADAVDDIKNKEFEEYWGQKQAVFFGDAGEAANVTLYELCQQRLFKSGDIFEYKRGFQGGLMVEKVLELLKVELLEDGPGVKKKKDACTLTFRCPPGTNKFLAESPVGTFNGESAGSEDADGEASIHAENNENGGKKDIILQVHSLAQLDTVILDEDGTVKAADPEKYKKYPAGNSWKTFTVRRNDEFLGSVFMMRQRYYEKSAAK